jgi:hypothetical protein
LPRTRCSDVFWQTFAVTLGKDHDDYVVASFGDAVEMATELADWSSSTSIGHGQLGLRLRMGQPV